VGYSLFTVITNYFLFSDDCLSKQIVNQPQSKLITANFQELSIHFCEQFLKAVPRLTTGTLSNPWLPQERAEEGGLEEQRAVTLGLKGPSWVPRKLRVVNVAEQTGETRQADSGVQMVALIIRTLQNRLDFIKVSSE